jgi:glycosyltransferase involved in cell wall biosynthesis
LWSIRRQFLQRSSKPPDAINLHFALYVFPLLQSLPKDVPVTFTFHGPWAIESQWEGDNQWSVLCKQWIENRVYCHCDRFIVLSKAFGNILHQTYRVPWHKIYVIPGGVNTVLFQPSQSRTQARALLQWPQDRFILFTARRLVHRMGLDNLLNALAIVRQKKVDIWLAIAGNGPLRVHLERQIQELGLSQHVQLLGFLPDKQLPLAYQAADFTIVPSQSLEGFGLVVVESLACGTPVLGTPVGGMQEILTAFSPQLIADSVQTHAIAHQIEAVIRGDISIPSRTDCREYAATQFNWPKIASQVQQVLLAKS